MNKTTIIATVIVVVVVVILAAVRLPSTSSASAAKLLSVVIPVERGHKVDERVIRKVYEAYGNRTDYILKDVAVETDDPKNAIDIDKQMLKYVSVHPSNSVRTRELDDRVKIVIIK